MSTDGLCVSFSSVLRFHLRLGVSAGLLAASATAGALVAFAAGQGSAARPFNAAAQLLLGGRALAADGIGWVSAVGLFVHVSWGILLGVALALLSVPLRGAWRTVAAVALAALLLLLHPRLAPFAISDGFAPLLTPGRRFLVYSLLAVALALGTRFALDSPYEEEEERRSDLT